MQYMTWLAVYHLTVVRTDMQDYFKNVLDAKTIFIIVDHTC